MFRKILLLFVYSASILVIGVFVGNHFDTIHLIRSVSLHYMRANEPVNTPEVNETFTKIDVIGLELCLRIYPAPKSTNDCLNSLNHGIARSFDPHTRYLNVLESRERIEHEKGVLEGVGVTIMHMSDKNSYVIGELISGGTADENGIRSGDEILAINGVPISEFSNVYAVARAIRGEPGSTVTLKILHAEESLPLDITLIRRAILRPRVEGNIISTSSQNFGYIRIHHFMPGVTRELRQHLERLLILSPKLSGLIIDLQGNPGGLLYEVDNALDLFMDAESFVLERDRFGIKPIVKNPIAYTRGDITNGLPILVIVDERSASASEIFSGSMQHNGRALVYGSQTYGKGTIQGFVALPDKSELNITIAEYLVGTMYDWIPVQCLGVTPDIIRVKQNDEKKFLRECMLPKSIPKTSLMVDPPPHRKLKRVRNANNTIGIQMIEAYEMFHSK